MFITRKEFESRIRSLEQEVSTLRYLLYSVGTACNLEYHSKQTNEAYFTKKKDN